MKPKFPRAATFVKGADFSEYQGTVDWAKVKKAGIAFGFIRASHGAGADTLFDSHRAGAKSVGIPVGFYHYFNPTLPVSDQVTLFVSTVGQLAAGDLGVVIDIEEPKSWANIAVKDRLGLVLSWLTAVEQQLGVKPLVYCSPNFIKLVLADSTAAPASDLARLAPLAKYKLWVANYVTTASPNLPYIWTSWLFWQYSDTTTIDGVTGDVDGNYFNGTLAELNNLLVPEARLDSKKKKKKKKDKKKKNGRSKHGKPKKHKGKPRKHRNEEE